MKITAKKSIWQNYIIQEEFEVRVQIKKGQIITLLVNVEDGCAISNTLKGKTDGDRKIIKKLPPIIQYELLELLDETEY